MVFSFLSYILGIESLSFFIPILFLLLCLFFHTLYTAPLPSLPSLLLSLSSSMLPDISYTTYFLLTSQEEIFVFGFHRFGLPYLHTLYSLYILLLPLLSTILSQAEVHLLEMCSPLYNIPMLFFM